MLFILLDVRRIELREIVNRREILPSHLASIGKGFAFYREPFFKLE